MYCCYLKVDSCSCDDLQPPSDDRIVPRLGQLASQPCQNTRKDPLCNCFRPHPVALWAALRAAEDSCFRGMCSSPLHLLPSCCRPFVPPSQLQRRPRKLNSGPHGMLAKTPHRPATARCWGGIHTASQQRCSLFVVLVSQLLDWPFAGPAVIERHSQHANCSN